MQNKLSNGYPMNPIVDTPNSDYMIMFKQNKDTMADTDIYSRFIHSVCNSFYASRFWKNYKAFVMGLGMDRSASNANITAEMLERLDCHHHVPTLKQAAIMITEHLIKNQGYANTFEVIRLIEEAHRNHMIAVTMMHPSEHQVFHSDPSSFISISQCWGRPDKFLDLYLDGMTYDIAMKFLLQIKQEYQYNGLSHTVMTAKIRDEILSWQYLNGYMTNPGGVFVPWNQNYNTPQYGYGYRKPTFF